MWKAAAAVVVVVVVVVRVVVVVVVEEFALATDLSFRFQRPNYLKLKRSCKNGEWVVVYFDQRKRALHFIRWLKYRFSHFLQVFLFYSSF